MVTNGEWMRVVGLAAIEHASAADAGPLGGFATASANLSVAA